MDSANKNLSNVSHVEQDDNMLYTYLYNNEDPTDITFIVGADVSINIKRMPAHKEILVAKSHVFKVMFCGGLATQFDEIEIPDVEPKAFLTLLTFIYTNKIKVDLKLVMTTLYAARKYAVSAVEEYCIDFLKENLQIDNVFIVLTYARLYEITDLITLCLHMIDKNTMEALATDGFLEIDLETLLVVLKRDTLIIFESDLFEKVLLWSKVMCHRKHLPVTPKNQRNILGPALSFIRFELMSLEKFVKGPVETDILNDSEFQHIVTNLASSEIPRCCTTISQCHLKFSVTYSEKSSMILYEDKFKVNTPVVIVGVVLHSGNIELGTSVAFTLSDNVENKECYHVILSNGVTSSTISQQRMLTESLLPVIFGKPIYIIPNRVYKTVAYVKPISARDFTTWSSTACNTYKCYENNLSHFKGSEGFSFLCLSNIISEIIYYK